MIKQLKNVIPFIIIAILLFAFSLFNKYFIKAKKVQDVSINKIVSDKVLNNDISDIDYTLLIKNLNELDNTIKLKLVTDEGKKKKVDYYNSAANIYQNKLTEILYILSKKLNNDDYAKILTDIGELNKKIDSEIESISMKYESSIDVEYYSAKYEFEAKQKKCRTLLEQYKGYLK